MSRPLSGGDGTSFTKNVTLDLGLYKRGRVSQDMVSGKTNKQTNKNKKQKKKNKTKQ